MLRVPADEVADRILAGQTSPELAGLRDLVTSLSTDDLGRGRA